MSGQRRIMVTGAGGFVGTWLTDRLAGILAPADEVLALGGTAARGAVVLDITRRAEVDEAVRSFRPTCVVHLAGVSSLAKALAEGPSRVGREPVRHPEPR